MEVEIGSEKCDHSGLSLLVGVSYGFKIRLGISLAGMLVFGTVSG